MVPLPPPLGDLPLCLEGRMLGAGGTGVSTYARNLQDTMARLTARPHVLAADHLDDPRARVWAGALRSVVPHVRTNGDRPGAPAGWIARDLFRRAHVHFTLSGSPVHVRVPGPPGIMHWTYPLPLVLDGWINLYTVHDAIPFTSPELTSIDPVRHRRVLSALAPHAARFVTVSEAARDEILATTKLPPSQVVNCGQSVDIAPPPAGELPAGLSPAGYLLFYGAIEPRKNVSRLLEAYRASGVALPLLIAGPTGWRGAPIIDDVQRTPGAHHLPYQSHESLMRLIASARAVLFPSLAEGFGLPVIEAMALGTPVLTSNRGAMREVAGDAALLVDPEDAADIAAAIRRLARGDSLTGALRMRGAVRARAFTAERFAARVESLYRDVLRTD